MRMKVLLPTLGTLLALAGGCDMKTITAPEAADTLTLKQEDGSLSMKSLTPPAGAVGGDTTVLVRGSGFTPGMKVLFGDQPATNVRVVNDGILTADVPVAQEGLVDVTLQANIDGEPHTVGLPGGFEYLLSPGGTVDTDGDGLTDAQEIAGWKVRVDYFGWGTSENEAQNLITYTVTSNASNADTDGDGLSDYKEFLAKSDPNLRDTDGDGLSDFEEVTRWHSSPVSVDTDADSRGPDGDKSPNTALFDGAELFTPSELAKNWFERSGLKRGATSPTLSDTDGDGATDYDEFDAKERTAIFADLPKLRIEIVDKVDIRLDVEYAEEQGTTTAYETAFSTATEQNSESTNEQNFSHTVGSSRTTTESSSESITVGAEVSFPTPWPSFSAEATMSWDSSVEVGESEETTSGGSSSSTVGTSLSAEESFSNYTEDSRAKTETSASGSMTMGVEIINEGDLSFKLSQLQFTVRQWQPNSDPANSTSPGSYKTFATLETNLGDGRVLAPGGASGIIQAAASDLNADRVKAFLRRPKSMVIEPASFEIENGEGLNFKFIQENTFAQTAEVIIDYGPGLGADEFRIATNVDRNPDGSLAGLKMKTLMDEAVGVGNWAVTTGNQDTPLTVPNNSFEQGACGGTIPGWTQTASPQTACAGTNGAPTAPDGTKWAALVTGQMYARIGTFSNASAYVVNFTQGANSTTGSGTVTLKLFAGAPTGGGTLVGTQSFSLPIGSAPLARSAVFTTGPAWVGRELWLSIEFGGGTSNVLIDNIQAFARTSIPRNLIRVKNVSAGSNPTSIWAVLIGGQDAIQSGTNFDDIVVHAGDGVLIAYWVDRDGDGLWDAQERAFGTIDSSVDVLNNSTWAAGADGIPDSRDTDHDGISDAAETRRTYRLPGTTTDLVGGWQVSVVGKAPYWVYSDPTKPDADGDGWTDFQERFFGTDPTLDDTDGDGIPDSLDPAPLSKGTVLFVNENAAADTGPGTAWATAYKRLDTAIARAVALNGNGTLNDDVTQIWVSQGNYVPTGQWFEFPNRVQILGGFTGIETSVAQRNADPLSNNTILGPGTSGRAGKFTNVVNTTALDGFLLSNCSQSAIWISGGSPTIRNCLFYNNNRPSDSGGAAFVELFGLSDAPLFERCTFTNNTAAVEGGAVDWIVSAFPNPQPDVRGGFVDCEFTSNRCERTGLGSIGGAVCVYARTGTPNTYLYYIDFTRCTFERNTVGVDSGQARGGAMFVGRNIAAQLTNCEFKSNRVAATFYDDNLFQWGWAGGAVAVEGNNANVQGLNCSFWNNSAQRFGGAVYVAAPLSGQITPEAYFTNCTFAENTAYWQIGPRSPFLCILNSYLFFVYDPATNSLGSGGASSGGGIGTLGRTVCDNCVLWNNHSTPYIAFCPGGSLCNGDTALKRSLDLEQQISCGPIFGETYRCFQNLFTGTFSLNNSCAFGAGRAQYWGDIGGRENISVDPQFVDSVNGDLHLKAGSPCIEHGNRLVDFSPLFKAGLQLPPAADLVNNHRIVDGDGDNRGQIDIGAFEFQP